MKTALVLIDIQNDYFPQGAMELVGSEEASLKAEEVLKVCRDKGLPVFHVQHVATKAGATFFLPDTFGAEIRENVRPLDGEPVIIKHFPNSFRETELLAQLKEAQVSRIVFCGMMTHMCVHAAVRAACDLGFECLVVHDACATRNLSFEGKSVAAEEVHTAFIAALNGSYAKVLSAEGLLRSADELL